MSGADGRGDRLASRGDPEHRTHSASTKGGVMVLTWASPGEIARSAIDAHPGTDSSDLDFAGRQRVDPARPDVGVHPDEARRESVVATWHEQR